MTIIKAREILGPYAEELTNEQIQVILDNFLAIIEAGLQEFEKQNGNTTNDAYYKP